MPLTRDFKETIRARAEPVSDRAAARRGSSAEAGNGRLIRLDTELRSALQSTQILVRCRAQ